VIGTLNDLSAGLRRFARLERILAVVLAFTPALLVLVDDGPDTVRGSISAYHDVSSPAAFYVPLTVGAMLFFVNGIVRQAHVYNTLLGVALSGVILFDHDGKTYVPHVLFAVAFFGGNVVVMVFFSTNKSTRLKCLLVGGIAAAGALLLFTNWFTLFWAEWVSLAVIATHFILDSVSWSSYRALRPDEAPKLAP
jgi:hypothetical protein